MIKIINNKKYDTETATQLLEYWNGCNTRDFRYCDETLYRKKTGEFFLHGNGGPLSKYATIVPNGKTGGEKIIPLTEEQARAWVEEFFDGEDYIRIFGDVEE